MSHVKVMLRRLFQCVFLGRLLGVRLVRFEDLEAALCSALLLPLLLLVHNASIISYGNPFRND